jgi:hypothetical protein
VATIVNIQKPPAGPKVVGSNSEQAAAAAGAPITVSALSVFQAAATPPPPSPPTSPLPKVDPKVSLLALSGRDEEEQEKMCVALKSYENGGSTVCPIDDLSEQFDDLQNKGCCSWLSGICHQTIKIGAVAGTAKPTLRSRPLARLMSPSTSSGGGSYIGSGGSTRSFQSPSPKKGSPTPPNTY